MPELFERLKACGIDQIADVLLIDDASDDNTALVARRCAKTLQTYVTVLKNPRNLGYGGNQKVGYEYAIREGYEAVVLLHGDCQYPPEFIKDLIEPIYSNRADVVFGSRMLDKRSALKGGMPLYKWLGNQITTAIQNKLLGSQLSECHSGFRAYRVAVLKKIPFRYNSNDFHFDADIIIQCHRIGAVIAEIPIPTRYATEICRVNGLQYCWNCLKSGLADKCTQLDVFYSRKFDMQAGPVYFSKLELQASSHSIALEMVPPCSTVVDLGGGNGIMAKELVARGCCVTVVDSDPQFVPSQAVTVVKANVQELTSVPSAEVVLLMDIIEHLPRKEQFKLLEKIRQMGGGHSKVIISVPNSVFLPVRLMMLIGRINYGRRGILDETHAFLFTRYSLKALLVSAGYNLGAFHYTAAPIAFVFPQFPRVANFLSRCQYLAAKVLPGLFAYQIIVEAYPQPTVSKLLQVAECQSTFATS